MNIMLKRFYLFAFILIISGLRAQQVPERPALIVGIVVDQMRYDYLYRYYDLYGDEGFKRMMREGFHFHNTNYPYIPTYTGPGHASIYSGTTPAVHGIIANNWYDRESNSNMYVVQDQSVQGVGTDTKDGQMSPRNMLTTTFTDEWRLFSNFRSKTIGIAIKDRGAVLPAGHTANAAYWYEGGSGKWVSSSFYMDKLPKWVNDYNKRKRPVALVQDNWEPMLPLERYRQYSSEDDNRYEGPFMGQSRPTFPHNLPVIFKRLGTSLIKNTPGGNTITFEMGMAAIEAEKLGQRGETDILTLSFSTPDYVGHQFGPRAMEIADIYVRFDQELAAFFRYLDNTIGKEKYLVFLTADHGAADNSLFLADAKIPSGIFSDDLKEELDTLLEKEFGYSNLIKAYKNLQFYLNDELIAEYDLDRKAIQQLIINRSRKKPEVIFAHTLDDYHNYEFTKGIREMVQLGVMDRRSGDVILILHPSYLERPWQITGTTHGTGYSYDTRVPLLFYGTGVPIGESFEQVEIIDIAPTISNMLRMHQPNGSTGKSLLPYMLK
jgi:predicted AlkP superfamily pyrophosphatase or phosphodiesterase